ncbi:MAG: cytochrome P450 [Sphingomonadales bacterium]|nr:cytochrome P450 [Sphingomonadales bacterium]
MVVGNASLQQIRVDRPAPDNVPSHLKVDLFWAMGGSANDLPDAYEPFAWLSAPDAPRLFYNVPSEAVGGRAGHGGWVVTHYEDIERVYTDSEHFSNKGTAEFQALIGETFRSIPIAVDPPEHGKYRRFLLQWLGPAQVNRMAGHIHAVCAGMIDGFAQAGEIDMAWDFARVFPVRIFMGLMGFPPAMFEQFLAWEWDILHVGGEARLAALRGVLDFLRGFMAEMEQNPADNLTASIVHGRIEGRPLTEEEKIGMVWFLWLGGLDTVAATIAQMFRRMALQPEIQRQLRADPSLIPAAVEEFLRTQPILGSMRKVRKDLEWHGVTLKAGDQIQTLNCAGNFDPAQFPEPRRFDLTRKGNRHFTFTAGVHLCLGAPLARLELRTLLAEWFRRIPEFRVKPGADTTVFPGLLSIRNLPLVWDADAVRD